MNYTETSCERDAIGQQVEAILFEPTNKIQRRLRRLFLDIAGYATSADLPCFHEPEMLGDSREPVNTQKECRFGDLLIEIADQMEQAAGDVHEELKSVLHSIRDKDKKKKRRRKPPDPNRKPEKPLGKPRPKKKVPAYAEELQEPLRRVAS